jgi:hypothetical protein
MAFPARKKCWRKGVSCKKILLAEWRFLQENIVGGIAFPARKKCWRNSAFCKKKVLADGLVLQGI